MSRPQKHSRIHWVAPALGALLSGVITPAQAADGYWLDQYNALLYLASFQLDRELAQMQRQGAGVVMVHADSLPDPLLRWIAWRARRAQLQPVARIQRPTVANLRRVSAVSGYQALQVDDHYFAAPPLPIERLKDQLAGRSLWCSFQTGQFSWRAAQACDHVDLQLYRQSCKATLDAVYRLGIPGARDAAVAVYHDGSDTDDRRLACLREQVRSSGHRLFVFKWKNPEHWLSPISGRFWQGLSRLRSWVSASSHAQAG